MVKTSLVEEYKTGGKELVQRLDKAGIDVRAAFWLYRDEADDWRLILGIPDVDQIGSLEVYRKLYPIWREHHKIDWSDITVLGLNDRLVQQLGSEVKTGSGLDSILFRRQVIDGSYIEDAYIYRMNL